MEINPQQSRLQRNVRNGPKLDVYLRKSDQRVGVGIERGLFSFLHIL